VIAQESVPDAVEVLEMCAPESSWSVFIHLVSISSTVLPWNPFLSIFIALYQ
jgi:hypothetical protein